MGEGCGQWGWARTEPSDLWPFPLLFLFFKQAQRETSRSVMQAGDMVPRQDVSSPSSMGRTVRALTFYGVVDAGDSASAPRGGTLPNNSRGPSAAAAAAAAAVAAASSGGGGTPRRSRAVLSPSDAHTSASCTSAGVDTGRYGSPSGVRDAYIQASLGGGRACAAEGGGTPRGLPKPASHRGTRGQRENGGRTDKAHGKG